MNYQKPAFIAILVFCFFTIDLNAQEHSPHALTSSLGIGYNDGANEAGLGTLFSLGYRKGYWNENRLRLNPHLLLGGFLPGDIEDIRDQYYRITSLGLDIQLDVIKISTLSLVASAGMFANYSRGLLGTGGMSNQTNSEYFNKLYFGGSLAAGLRLHPDKSRLSYQFNPVNLRVGSDGFLLGFIHFGIEYTLLEKDE